MLNVNYNEISKIYDTVRQGDLLTIQRIINEGKINLKSTILEIGCGTGNYTNLMQTEASCIVYGLDQSEGMLEKAEAKNNKISYFLGDAVKLDCFGDSMFDVIYMIDVIHHIKDINTMFENIYRKLKPGGAIFIFTDSHEHIKNRLTSLYFPETLDVELNRYQSTETLIEALQQNNFINIKSDSLVLPDYEDYGRKLIDIAEKRGYSMFNLISDDAIARGITKIKEEMTHTKIAYPEKAPYIFANKYPF